MTLNELFLEYDLKRNKSAARAAERKAFLLKKIPELSGLFLQKENICLEQMQETLLRPQDRRKIAEKAQNSLAEINARISALVSEKDLASIEPIYECPICRDTGYDDRARRKLCSCMVHRIYTDLYGTSPLDQLTGSFETYDPAVFKTPEQQLHAKAVRVFAEKYASGKIVKPFLIFMGSSGLGKSFTMSCIAKKMSETCENVLYIGAFALFQAFHQSRLGYEIPLDPIYDADVLLIDDLGTEPMTVNVTQEYFFRLLEHRIFKKLPTVFATNMNSTQLKDRYTEKITSRLFSSDLASVLRLSGEDVRLKSVGK